MLYLQGGGVVSDTTVTTTNTSCEGSKALAIKHWADRGVYTYVLSSPVTSEDKHMVEIQTKDINIEQIKGFCIEVEK